MSNSHLMREVRLHENSHERENADNMAELFALLTSLECLEKMFSKDQVNADEYKTECFKLLDQLKVVMRYLPNDMEAFTAKYRLHCPAALERIREGRPITVKDDKGNLLKNIASIVEVFITFFDQLKLGVRAVDELYPNLNELFTSMMALSRLPEDYDGKVKVKKWHDKLSSMAASDEISEEECRQMSFELESAYAGFIKFLNDTKH